MRIPSGIQVIATERADTRLSPSGEDMDVRIDSQPGSDDDRFEDRTTLGVKKSSRRSRRSVG